MKKTQTGLKANGGPTWYKQGVLKKVAGESIYVVCA